MKKSILLLLILFIGSIANLHSQCTNEKGFYDFPFTQDGITVTGSGTGGYTYYTSSWTSCGIPLKGNSVYIGASASTYTNEFTTPVNDMVYAFGAANVGEIVTVTVNAGTPSISYTGGDCGSVVQISGNVISFLEPTPANGHGGRITIHSTSPFTSVSFSHNGAMSGLLMTMCFDAVFESVKPTVTTTAITSITGNSATSGGDVTADGGAAVTAKGVCWNTTGTPVATGNHTSNGTGTGSFSSSITGLSAGTLYYVRAYATNANGTAYGTELTFTTSSNPTPSNPTSVSATNNPICSGTSTQLTANGAVGTVYWYTGSCGGTQVTPGNPITVSPLVTTTYYARNYNNSQFSEGCASLTITVNPLLQYRTVQSGNWTTAANWEQYNGSTWVTATSYPGQITNSCLSPLVTVQTDHTIEISSPSNIEIPNLKFVGTGKTIVRRGAKLTVNTRLEMDQNTGGGIVKE